MSEPFTIIITTYQRPKLLQRAARSALNQDWDALTVLILDDASGDETGGLMKEIASRDSRLKYVCHGHRIGMLENYRYGLKNVQTEFFTFLSDDDFLLPHYCKTVMPAFRKYPEIAFSAGSCVCVSINGKISSIPHDRWPEEELYHPPYGMREMLGKIPIPNTIAFRKSRIEPDSIDFENQPVWDWDFILQIGAKHPFAISKVPCGFLFAHAGSFTTNTNRKKVCECHLRLIDRIRSFSFLPEKLRDEAASYYLTQYHRLSLKHLIENGDYQKAIDSLEKLLAIPTISTQDWAIYQTLRTLCQIPFIRMAIAPARKLFLWARSLLAWHYSSICSKEYDLG